MDEQNGQGKFNGLAEKSQLERTLQAGIQGAPQLRGEERSHYLGEFRERVLRVLTRDQVGEHMLYQEIDEALKDPRSALLVLHGDIGEQAVQKYKKLAAAQGKEVTSRRDSSFTGEAGLVVASRDAVDIDYVEVETRRERLLRKGLTEQIIDASGEALCKECYSLVRRVAPEELCHYRLMDPISRLFKEKCPGHDA